MAATIPNNLLSLSEAAIVKLSLDTGPFTFDFSTNDQTLYIDNGEGTGSFVVNYEATAGVTTFPCDGIEDQDVSAGRDITVNAGELFPVKTFSRRGYFGGVGSEVTVTITGTVTAASSIWTTASS